jgi:hypothetical protein
VTEADLSRLALRTFPQHHLTASIASRAAAFDVARQLVEGLITEFDRAEPYPRIALRLRRMQLPQCDDGLAQRG